MSQYVSKVIYGSETLIDLTSDTVDSSNLLTGYTAHGADGALVSGGCTFDADTKDATATVNDILSGQTAYKNGSKITGNMPNRASQKSYIEAVASSAIILQGYHDGSGYVAIASADQSKIIPENIREGISILGVVGTMSGSEDVKATSLSATPYTTAKTYLPTGQGDYNYFSQVTVASIAYTSVSNPAGGLTVTIGTVAPA